MYLLCCFSPTDQTSSQLPCVDVADKKPGSLTSNRDCCSAQVASYREFGHLLRNDFVGDVLDFNR